MPFRSVKVIIIILFAMAVQSSIFAQAEEQPSYISVFPISQADIHATQIANEFTSEINPGGYYAFPKTKENYYSIRSAYKNFAQVSPDKAISKIEPNNISTNQPPSILPQINVTIPPINVIVPPINMTAPTIYVTINGTGLTNGISTEPVVISNLQNGCEDCPPKPGTTPRPPPGQPPIWVTPT